MQVKDRTRPRQRERRAARRAAFHAERIDRAATPAARLQAAAAYLVSAAAHGKHSAQSARAVTRDITEHARQLIARAGLPGPARALHEAKLTAGGTDVQRLAAALMVLRSVLGRLPEAESDRLREHYASELAAEAARIPRR